MVIIASGAVEATDLFLTFHSQKVMTTHLKKWPIMMVHLIGYLWRQYEGTNMGSIFLRYKPWVPAVPSVDPR